MDPNPKTIESREEIVKRRSAFLNLQLTTLATALGMELSEDRAKLYRYGLIDLSDVRLRYAFGVALREFRPKYGVTYPAIAELREWATQCKPTEPGNLFLDEYKQNSGKPANWEPIPKEELSKLTEQIKSARLKAMPDIREISESMVAEKNGASEVPLDPGERRAWARNKAVENGWAEREPGDES